MTRTADVAIVGGGIVGLAMAHASWSATPVCGWWCSRRSQPW